MGKINTTIDIYRRGVKTHYDINKLMDIKKDVNVTPIIFVEKSLTMDDRVIPMYGFPNNVVVDNFLKACNPSTSNVEVGLEVMYDNGWNWVSNLKPSEDILRLIKIVKKIHSNAFYIVGFDASTNNFASHIDDLFGTITQNKINSSNVTLPSIAIFPGIQVDETMLSVLKSKKMVGFSDACLTKFIECKDWKLFNDYDQNIDCMFKDDNDNDVIFKYTIDELKTWKRSLDSKYISERLHFTYPYVIFEEEDGDKYKFLCPGSLISGLMYCQYQPGLFPTTLELDNAIIPSGKPFIYGMDNGIDGIISKGIGTFEYVEGRASFFLVGNYNSLGAKNGTIASNRRYIATVLLCDKIDRDLKSNLRAFLDKNITDSLLQEIKHIINKYLENLGDVLSSYNLRLGNADVSGKVGELVFFIDLYLAPPLEFVGFNFTLTENSK